jgi:hypothetical protein
MDATNDDIINKQYLLGRFEEAVLLATIACGNCGTIATADAVRTKVERKLGERQITTIITTLDRLKSKGYVESNKELEAEKRRGGKKRLIYSATRTGVDNLSRSLTLINDLAKEAGFHGETGFAA